LETNSNEFDMKSSRDTNWGVIYHRSAFLIGALAAFLVSISHAGEVPDFTGAEVVGRDGRVVHEFRGIRFAEAPTGFGRWHPPEPHRPTGAVAAISWPPACPQGDGNVTWYRQIATAFGNEPTVIPPTPTRDEDCLFLNVWTMDVTARRPVMVWIHGGSNKNGWSFEPNYQGLELATRGVVVVSIQYRLGVLGFLSHPELTAESRTGSSGSYALLDQLEALRWVQRHIEQFGGDPHNVTLFGESAGAGDIGYLLLSPLADGLFHKAISQSGGWSADQRRSLREKEAQGVVFTEALGEGIADLREMGAVALVDAAGGQFDRDYDDPAVDGWLLPEPAPTLLKQGAFQRRPVIFGSNADEMRMYIDEVSEAAWDAVVASTGNGEEVQMLLGHLPLLERLDSVASASTFHCPTRRMADAFARWGAPTYVYRFEQVRRGNWLGAYHGAEIPYVFDRHDDWLPVDEDDRRLTELMMDYWVQFAKTGNPNVAGAPGWPRWEAGGRAMRFESSSSARPLSFELCALLGEEA